MKKLLFLAIFVLLFLAGRVEAYNWGRGISFNYFYTTLSPYGEWIQLDDGIYAWHPYDVSVDWQPYSVGRWVWSEYGWYWDSFEPFGWAVYHYGRWYNDDYYGWIWIPDYDWGPSWVEWRYNDDYIGWAPLPPYAVFRAGIGIHFTIDWHFPVRYWNYVRCDHFYDYEVHRYLIPERVKYRIYNETRYRTNYDYRDGRVINRGIDRDFIERRAGRPVTERNIVETSRLRDFEGSRSNVSRSDRVEVFRPNQQEVSRVREVPRTEIKRSDRPTSLDLSKVERRNTPTTPEVRQTEPRQIEQRQIEPRRNREVPVYRNSPQNGNQQVPQAGERKVEERRVEERKVEERRTDDRRQDAPRENRREENRSRDDARSRGNSREKSR